MTDGLRLTFRPGDLLAAAGVLLCAAAGVLVLIVQTRALPAEPVLHVRQNGILVQTLSLGTDTTFDLTGKYTNTVVIQDGQVSVVASDCPGADCAHSGWISAPGRSIVCLPNRVELRLVGEVPDGGVDGVAG